MAVPSAACAAPEPLTFTVHGLPARPAPTGRWRGRLTLLLVLLACAAPVLVSYLLYYVVRPEGRSNYATLIQPSRGLPDALPLTDLEGHAVDPASLRRQWLLVVVADAACDARCEQLLLDQRQLRAMLGRERDRVDNLWLVTGSGPVRPALLEALGPGARALRVPEPALAAWLQPAPGQRLADHLYVVDPMGEWMMRSPAEPDPLRLRRDLERLLRASAFWDRPGREVAP